MRRRYFLSFCLCTALTLLGCGPAKDAFAAEGRAWPLKVTDFSLQEQHTEFEFLVERCFGGPGDDYAFDLWPAGDEGYVITGRTEDPEKGDMDLAVIRVDADGKLTWAKRFGGFKLEMGFGVRTLKDGTIVVAGWTHSFGAGEGDVYLLGISPDGDLKFEKTFGGPGDDRGTSLTVTSDGGIAVIGESYSFGEGDSRFYLVKTSADGTLQWERTYDNGPLNERGIAILEDEEGFLLIGNAMDSTSGSRATVSDGYVVRTDREGNVIWSKSYGGEQHDIFHHVAPLENKQFLLTGYTRGYNAKGESDLWLVTIDNSGNIVRSELFGGAEADHNIIARKAPDGDVYLGGYSQNAGKWDAQILKLLPSGKPDWSLMYGGPGDDGAVAVYPIDKNTLVVTGFTESFGAGNRDILFLKLRKRQTSSGAND